MSKTHLFQAILFSQKVKCFQVLLCITNNLIKPRSFIHAQLNVKTVLFQTIQFFICTEFIYIRPKDRTLSGATTPGQSGPRSDGDKEVLCILQSSCITEASPSDCLVSYLGHSLGECYPSAEMQSVYSADPVDWVKIVIRIRWCIT